MTGSTVRLTTFLTQAGARLRALAGLLACAALVGCVESEKVLLPLEGVDIPTDLPFLVACDDSCSYGWIRRTTTPGRLVGGFHDGSADGRRVSLHKIGGENQIAQVVQYGYNNEAYPRYLLVRVRQGTMWAYDIDLSKVNPKYMEELAATGGVVDKAGVIASRAGLRHWEVQDARTLVRLFTDLGKQPDEELAKMGKVVRIKASNANETAADIHERATRKSAVALAEDPVSVNVPVVRASSGCPAVMPPKVTCRVYKDRPRDQAPQLDPEVIYFKRYGCGLCRKTDRYVAAWQMASKGMAFHYNEAFVGEHPSDAARLYDLDRVPSFAVNRKYLIALETDDKSTVEYALALVSSLSKEDSK